MSSSPRFDPEQLIADCAAALSEAAPQKIVRELLERAVKGAPAVLDALGPPERGGVQRLHQSAELTVLNVVWGPDMHLLPHNHEMWAVIGVYDGREDNIFWRRVADEPARIDAASAKTLGRGDVITLGRDVIHSVINPLSRFTSAIHVYGGDFFTKPRSEWDPETLLEEPYDVARNMRRFEASNAR